MRTVFLGHLDKSVSTAVVHNDDRMIIIADVLGWWQICCNICILGSILGWVVSSFFWDNRQYCSLGWPGGQRPTWTYYLGIVSLYTSFTSKSGYNFFINSFWASTKSLAVETPVTLMLLLLCERRTRKYVQNNLARMLCSLVGVEGALEEQ